jgi:hypothetical protein
VERHFPARCAAIHGAVDVKELFAQYAEGGGVSVDDDVIKAIWSETQGHRGWTVQAGITLSRTPNLPSVVSGAYWNEHIASEFRDDLRSTKQVKYMMDWFLQLPRTDALTVPALLQRIEERAAAGKPAKMGEGLVFEWAGDRAEVWEPMLPPLLRDGVIKYDDANKTLTPGLPLMRTAIEERVHPWALTQAKEWLTALPRKVALTVPALLTAVATATSPTAANISSWAGVHAVVWKPLLESLITLGAVKVDVAGVLTLGDEAVRGVISEQLREWASVRPPTVDVTKASVGDILEDAVDASAPIVQLFFHDTQRTSALFPDMMVPREDSYQAALLHVLQTWLGFGAVVPSLTLKGERLAIDVAWPAKRTLIELVCHERAGPESQCPSVAGHVKKLVKKYGPLFPVYEHLWLVNFDTERECGEGDDGKEAVLSAATDCNRMHVVVELEPHIAVVSVTTWLKGKSVPE